MTLHPGENTESLRPDDPRELGPYRLLARLGRGGMGTVFLGQDTAGRQVAVKVINRELAGEAAFRERFRREVTAARQVRRFCTAPVLDAELDRDPLYVVTEFIEGPSLEQAVAERGPLPGSDLEGIAVGVATALSAIHGAGIVHRDLKPANVLLSGTGPRVIDFGIARALDAVDGPTRTGQFIGTPSYMPPELLHGEPVSPASDVFAWGCVVAFAGTGRPPFAGNTVPQIFYKIVHEPPVLDGLDPALRDLVAAALDKDPRNRPTTQDLLARLLGTTRPDLEAATETVRSSWPHRAYALPPPPTHQPPPPPTGPLSAPSAPRRRRRLLFPLLGGAGVLAVIAAVVLAVTLTGNPLGEGPPKAGAALLPKDNFDFTGSGWDNGEYSCGRYTNGTYTLKVTGFVNEQSCATPRQKSSSTQRYLLDTRVKLGGGPSSGQWDAGLFILKENSLQYDVVLRPDGAVHLREVDNGKGVIIAQGKAGGFERNDFNQLQVLLDLRKPNAHIQAWVNGDKVLDHTLARARQSGQTGLIVNRPSHSSGEAEAEAAFDDYGIYEVGVKST